MRVVLALLLVFSFALGQGLEEQLKKAEELKKARAAEAARIEAELKNLDQKTRETRKKLAATNRELSRLAREIRTLNARIEALKEEIARLERELAQKSKAFEARKRELARLLDLLWRERASGALPVVRATSFTELAVKNRWLAALGSAELALVQSVKREAEELASLKRKREALLKELERARAELREKERALKARQQELKRLLASLDQHKQAKALKLAELQQAQAELDAEIERLQKALEEERRARERSLGVPKELVGRLLFPIAGGRIIKRYGQEDSDFEWIKAPRPGAPVRAAAAGQVFAVVYYGNVGWTVMIQHTDQLFTQYVNLQEPPVNTGDYVEQGEIIGYLGGGALIPPDVLWFRVAIWKNGQFHYVDPDPYF